MKENSEVLYGLTLWYHSMPISVFTPDSTLKSLLTDPFGLGMAGVDSTANADEIKKRACSALT
jgi:hypothetical protein